MEWAEVFAIGVGIALHERAGVHSAKSDTDFEASM